MTVLRVLNALSFYGYVGALFVLGLSGVFIPEYELQTLYQVDLTTVDHRAAVTLLHQYRFLKGIVVGCGVFAVVFRREIYTLRTFNRVFLGIVFSGAAARVLSLVVDGRPPGALLSFTISEFVFGLIMVMYSRTALIGGDRDAR